MGNADNATDILLSLFFAWIVFMAVGAFIDFIRRGR
jgi:hypothetical protein